MSQPELRVNSDDKDEVPSRQNHRSKFSIETYYRYIPSIYLFKVVVSEMRYTISNCLQSKIYEK